jgi:hypothetical protein
MAHSDWIPSREQDLVDLAARWDAWLSETAKKTAFGWDSTVCTQLINKLGDFLAARNEYETDKTAEKRMDKDEAKEHAVDAMRDFANGSIRFNKKMSDSDWLYMGVHPKDTTHTTHPAPTSKPDTDVLPTTNHYEHRVRAMNHALGDTSKPPDAYGVRYARQVGGESPVSGADLPKTKFTRKPTLIVTHSEADKGKTAFYSSCYENSKGDQARGDRCEIIDYSHPKPVKLSTLGMDTN